MSNIKPFLYTFILLLPALVIGITVGYFKYFQELKYGSDDVDAFRWAFITGFFCSLIGLPIGLIINSIIWYKNEPSEKKR